MRLHARRKVKYYSCCAQPYPDITYTIQVIIIIIIIILFAEVKTRMP